MAAILPSRFAVLKVEGEEPEEPKVPKKPQSKSGSVSDRNSEANKTKPKKKKRPADKDGQVRFEIRLLWKK